jgi:hypothetical protein
MKSNSKNNASKLKKDSIQVYQDEITERLEEIKKNLMDNYKPKSVNKYSLG